ncbi:hypothetical protein TRVL_01255 [Trypanosoma vivax]|nr:hypothetical protein TRVL_01255 [Trypanosoma vivax]
MGKLSRHSTQSVFLCVHAPHDITNSRVSSLALISFGSSSCSGTRRRMNVAAGEFAPLAPGPLFSFWCRFSMIGRKHSEPPRQGGELPAVSAGSGMNGVPRATFSLLPTSPSLGDTVAHSCRLSPFTTCR